MGYGKADLVLYNSSVMTFDDKNPSADCVAVKGNTILGVGRKSDFDSLIGPDTIRIDCLGNTVIPGFNDAHCHPISYALAKLQVDCSPRAVKSIEDIKVALREKAKTTTPGAWLKGAMYNETHLEERRHPTRRDLDQGAPDHPVILTHYSGANCVLNSEALKRVGITRERAMDDGGIGVDPVTMEPNGIVFGMNEMVRRGVPSVSREELTEGFRLASEDYLSHGITSLQDTGWNNGVEHWRTYRSIKEDSRLLSSRVSMLLGLDAMEAAREIGLEMNRGDAFLRIGGVKIALDDSTGCDYPPQEALDAAALQVIGAGYPAAFHVSNLYQLTASGEALQLTLDTYPNRKLRHRFEHCLLCTPGDISVLSKLPVMVVTQPSILYYQGAEIMETIPEDRRGCILPLKAFTKAGIEVALSSDAPMMPVNPFLGIYNAVTRRELSGNRIASDEGISISEALKMYTLSGARASVEEKIKGSITQGKLADLVVLDRDIARCDPEEIKEVSVLKTIIDGKVVWER